MTNLSTLVVDDDQTARDMLSSILRSLGCNVIHTAADGDEGITITEKEKPDIVFLDIEMPGKNGLQTLTEILSKNSDQFIAMVSGHSSIDNVKESMGNGAKGFIVKPYTIAKVADMLEKYGRDQSPSPDA